MSTAVAFAGAHLAILGLWLTTWLVLAGSGALVLRAVGGSVTSWRDVSASFWLGIAGVIGLLQLWHLLFPVDGRTAMMVVLSGVAGLWTSRQELRALARRTVVPSWSVLAGLLVLLLWFVNRGLGPSEIYDTGMYHQPAVNWINAYAIVPGLGNLHGRLAFNSSSFLLAALFDVGPFDRLAFHVTIGLLLATLAIEGVLSWWSARDQRTPRAFLLFSIAILPYVIHGAVRREISSLSTDAMVAVMLLAATRYLFDALAHRAPERSERSVRMACVVTLLTAAVTIKLSAAVFAALAGVVAALLLARRAARDEVIAGAQLARWIVPPAILAIPWLLRGVWLSGYALYPSTLMSFAVDWRVPAEQAAGDLAWIVMSAKALNSNVIFAGLSWGRPWLREVLAGDLFVLFTLPGLVAAAACAWRLIARRSARHPLWASSTLWLLLPVAGALVFWAWSAPHPRLVQGILWSAGGIIVAAVFASTRDPERRPAATLALFAAGLTVVLLVRDAVDASREGKPGGALHALVTPPTVDWLAPFPTRPMREFVTAHGLQLAQPVRDNRCSNGPLVCTPHPTPHLRLRSNDVADGFQTVGDVWAPESWPNPFSKFLPWWRCAREGVESRRAREQRCERAISAAPATGG